MSTRSYNAEKIDENTYRGVYCHYDGYLEYNGRMLLDHYNTAERVKKLLDLGCISSLHEKLEPDAGSHPYMVCTYKDNDVRRAVALEQAKAATEEEALADPKKSKVYYHYMDHTAVPMAGYVDNLGQYVKGIEDYVPMS